jgi:lon-related putative ATP-dependent protease
MITLWAKSAAGRHDSRFNECQKPSKPDDVWPENEVLTQPTVGPMEQYRLAPERLRRRLDPASLPFASTQEVAPLIGILGQERAMEALRFGVGIDSPGYNLFATGLSGTGRVSTVKAFLGEIAPLRPTPGDWVHVHNFDQADRPKVLNLPAGRGRELSTDMESFIRQARQQITHAFETERYAERRRQLATDLGQRREPMLEELGRFARQRDFAIEATPNGIVAVPVRQGKPMTPEDVERLPESERQDLERRGTEVQTQVAITFRRLSQVEREGMEQIASLDREIARFAIEPLLHGLREKYAAQEGVIAHLDRIGDDIPDHLPDFRQVSPGSGGAEPTSPLEASLTTDHTIRYRVNVIVDNTGLVGAPITVETNPTYYNLLGRIEYRATFGTMVTDFRQIKGGALHRANGGFLILEAADVLRNPFAWEALMRALSTRQVRIENLGEQYSALPTGSLAPAPMPLDTKVVLIGSPVLYQLLHRLDEEFRELFKVKVDFSPEVEWTEQSVTAYAAFISRCVGENGLKHFDRGAVARLVEETSRWRENQRKLSARLRDVSDLATEASYWAGQQSHALVLAEDVGRAVEEKELRSSLPEERLRELIDEGTLRVETEGSRVGQLNGLSVIELGDHHFGVPSRVSASVALGRGTMESIERETELGGPIHNKGFLIVSGYLASTYAQQWPLAMRATLTFEQSYDGVEGDSASSTELYALLSALAEVPLKQHIAVTGSVDQHGSVQAVGGVTDKVEGFFKVCKARTLSGDQGVVIPAANVSNLMLSDEVIDAVREGKFSIWAVDNVDQGIEILTGRPAGERGPDGSYSDGSIHRLVAEKLHAYAKLQAIFARSPDGVQSLSHEEAPEHVHPEKPTTPE